MRVVMAGMFTLFALSFSAVGAPKLIAHRGASASAPENTLAAFRQAWKEGADGIEGDFFLTADGQVVCIHDRTTKRTGDRNLDVTKSSLAELRQLDVGRWKGAEFQGERVPTLAEILDILPAGKWLFIEIKDTPRIVEPISRILAEKKADPQRVVLISFSSEVVRACRQLMPQYPALWISTLKDIGGRPALAERYLKELRASGAQGLAMRSDAPVSVDWLKQARGNTGFLAAWTVDDAVEAQRMAALGIDFIITNRPGEIRRLMCSKRGGQRL
jgi:glycerophosphoryl diester phosphodiesterase